MGELQHSFTHLSLTMLRYLSLFSGIGCDALAIERVKERFPSIQFMCVGYSEIDENAINVYRTHFPHHQNVGSVQNLTADKLKNLMPIDLVIGGSPCQGFSQAGKRKGLKDNRSKLFWEYVRIVTESHCRFFVLENVGSMKTSDRLVISKALGVDYVKIPSQLLTAQNRNRLYWCNFKVTVPNDLHVYLNSVVKVGESDDRKYVIHGCDLHSVAVRSNQNAPFAFTLTRKSGPNRSNPYAKIVDFEHIPRTDNKSNPCICTVDWTSLIYDGKHVRRLYVDEYEQLQGLPVGYTAVNNYTDNVRRRLIGNSFTVPIIEHIVSCIDMSSSRQMY